MCAIVWASDGQREKERGFISAERVGVRHIADAGQMEPLHCHIKRGVLDESLSVIGTSSDTTNGRPVSTYGF